MRRKNDGKIVLILIFVLVAFIVGAGIGVTMGLDGGNNDKNETHIKNVTVEMTTNLNETDDEPDRDDCRGFAPSSFILQKIRVSKYMRRRREGDI